MLVFVPRFSYIQKNQHLKDGGRKEIGQKGYKFFVENYIHDVYVGKQSRHGDLACIVQARCHRSQRKNEDPHSLAIEVVNSNGDSKISNAKCSVKQGLYYDMYDWCLVPQGLVGFLKLCL